MTLQAALFTIEELRALDEKQLHLLRHAIEKEITTNSEIQNKLRDAVKEKCYDRLIRK